MDITNRILKKGGFKIDEYDNENVYSIESGGWNIYLTDNSPTGTKAFGLNIEDESIEELVYKLEINTIREFNLAMEIAGIHFRL